MDEYILIRLMDISLLNPIQVQLHNIYIKSQCLKDVHKVFWHKQAQILV